MSIRSKWNFLPLLQVTLQWISSSLCSLLSCSELAGLQPLDIRPQPLSWEGYFHSLPRGVGSCSTSLLLFITVMNLAGVNQILAGSVCLCTLAWLCWAIVGTLGKKAIPWFLAPVKAGRGQSSRGVCVHWHIYGHSHQMLIQYALLETCLYTLVLPQPAEPLGKGSSWDADLFPWGPHWAQGLLQLDQEKTQ